MCDFFPIFATVGKGRKRFALKGKFGIEPTHTNKGGVIVKSGKDVNVN